MRTDDGLSSANNDLGRALSDLRGQSQGFQGELGDLTRQMRDMDAEAQRLSRSIGTSLKNAFQKAVSGGADLGEVFRDLALDISGKALSSALKPVQNALGAGLTSAVGSLTGSVTSLLGFQNGGAFSSGRVRAFASGGVVNGPTVFPMRNGMGLMGEAGPEAIMPLTRGPDGRLGVRAAGGGGSSVTVNIQTQDVESFRRSRGQVAAEIARAAGAGRRRL
ncbi:MAG: phage tail tape measure protein [Pseudomonadota bacterium]